MSRFERESLPVRNYIDLLRVAFPGKLKGSLRETPSLQATQKKPQKAPVSTKTLDLQAALYALVPPLRLDAPLSAESEVSVGDRIIDTVSPTPFEVSSRNALRKCLIEEAHTRLTPEERFIIGARAIEGMNPKQVARTLHISEESVAALEQSAKDKLAQSEALREFYR